MKRYKLKKDALTVKAGTIFEEEGNSDNKRLVQVTQDWCLIRPEIAIRNILNFDDWFEEIPEESRRWRSEKGHNYCFIGSDGVIHYEIETHDGVDDYRYNAGIYGRTEQELEAKREYDIARQVLLDDAKGGKWKKDGSNYCAYYDYDEDDWGYDDTVNCMQTIGIIYFQNLDDIKDSLEEHKEQWEIVRKYEAKE